MHTSHERRSALRTRLIVMVGLGFLTAASALACNSSKEDEAEKSVNAAEAGEPQAAAATPEPAPQPAAEPAAVPEPEPAAAEPVPQAAAAAEAAPIPADAQPVTVDLTRVAHHFVGVGLEGEDLLPFEAQLLSDRTVYRVDTRARLLMHKADDGSLIGFVDHNSNGTPDSRYGLAEIATLEPGAEPDTVEIAFRIHHAVEENVLVFSDREHNHVRYVLTGTEFAGVPITTWMSSRQYAFYGEFWTVPASWTFQTTYVLPPEPEVAKARPRSAKRAAPKKDDSGVSFETGIQGGKPHINIKLKK